MPKKTASSRGSVQRNRPRIQKSFELVRPTTTTQEQELEAEEIAQTAENTNGSSSADMATSPIISSPHTPPTTRSSRYSRTSQPPAAEEPSATAFVDKEQDEKPGAAISAAPKSAAARLAARRAAAQRTQRAAVNLITAEHYAYVRADLVKIAILALIMFGIIIGLHFVPGIGS